MKKSAVKKNGMMWVTEEDNLSLMFVTWNIDVRNWYYS
jgi:hypothetical protein